MTQDRWPRFSLLSLIGLVALAALGCAALVNASFWWLLALSTTNFVIVMLAALVGLFGHGPRRAFAGGFAVCFVAYLTLVYYVLDDNSGSSRIVTSYLLKRGYEATATENASVTEGVSILNTERQQSIDVLVGKSPIAENTSGSRIFIPGQGPLRRSVTHTPDLATFLQIGQQLWALAIGCLGGAFGSHLWRHRPELPATTISR